MSKVYVRVDEFLLVYHRAADWNLSAPDWRGRMRVVSVGEKCRVKLEDKISGLTM